LPKTGDASQLCVAGKPDHPQLRIPSALGAGGTVELDRGFDPWPLQSSTVFGHEVQASVWVRLALAATGAPCGSSSLAQKSVQKSSLTEWLAAMRRHPDFLRRRVQ
jgi:hypothetical protein